MSHSGHSNKHLLWMLLGCGILVLALAFFGDRIQSGWLIALVIGVCVVPHLFMMRKSRHHEDRKDPKDKGGSCCQ